MMQKNKNTLRTMQIPTLIVPHNSLETIEQKRKQMSSASSFYPVENSARNLQPEAQRCQHCENMAKNFLYLESLLRTNINEKYPCNLCFSSLKFLEYINKNIMKIFGNFDDIVVAAKIFSGSRRRHFNIKEQDTQRLKRYPIMENQALTNAESDKPADDAQASKPKTKTHAQQKMPQKLNKAGGVVTSNKQKNMQPKSIIQKLDKSKLKQNVKFVQPRPANQQSTVKQNIVKQNIVKQNIVKQNIVKQNIVKQNIVKQNLVKQNIVKQNTAPKINNKDNIHTNTRIQIRP